MRSFSMRPCAVKTGGMMHSYLYRSSVEMSFRADFDTNMRKPHSASGSRHPASGGITTHAINLEAESRQPEPAMLYNSRHSKTSPREHTRPPTPLHRLLHSGLGNHGGRGLASH